MVDQAIIARFRVACDTGQLPADLGREILMLLERRSDRVPAARIARRNKYLISAAHTLSGSLRARSERLAAECLQPSDTITGLMCRQAMSCDPYRPAPKARQIARVIRVIF